ncbi:MAG: putative selenate reductase subunit YgfK [Bacteroidales bacterium]
MPDKFYPPALEQLLQIILSDLNHKGVIFDIPEKIFYKPWHYHYLYSERYGQKLHNPLGLAAGPHTQLAQNIVKGWLCGARFIELKTVQANDHIHVTKPCIDMQDEGYNCEWSQELSIEESFDQYLNAWILIHILHHRLFSKIRKDLSPGTIFNMSVGYSLSDIRSEKVQWFIDKMMNCREIKDKKIKAITALYPEIDKIDIPDQISNSVTLSTMHGCPPREVEYIVKFLLVEKKLHTSVKLNPTLLGAGSIRAILNPSRGYHVEVPDSSFENDLKYIDALRLLDAIKGTAKEMGLQVGMKISNTLECLNQNTQLPASEEKVYLSGKALHPIAVNLAAKFQDRFEGMMDISFSGGADCFNIVQLLKCGLSPITVCSDLLKPGGYGRLLQYFEQISRSFASLQAKNIYEFILKSSHEYNVKTAALEHLKDYAIQTLNQRVYQKQQLVPTNIKTDRPLYLYDCIEAPCVGKCPTLQDIPDYLWHASQKNFDKSFEAIFRNNPFPSVTGMICDHPCQVKCTRINYDESILIREIKRFVAENAPVHIADGKRIRRNGKKVAVIGAGPTGLSCAWYLNLSGFYVDIFESTRRSGGMVASLVPDFRMTESALLKDLERIKKTGITIHRGSHIDKKKFEDIYKNFDYVYIATGAWRARKGDFYEQGTPGILDPIEFLQRVKQKQEVMLGKNVVVIGGGNTAMDAARSAFRLVGDEGSVSLMYRRTIQEMPADRGEIEAVLDEGINVLELMKPLKALTKNGRVSGLECITTQLKGKDKSGRLKPVDVPGTEFTLAFDTVIPAIGQELHIDFIDTRKLKTKTGSHQTQDPKIFIGGDALRGASTAINAIGDGRKAAAEITAREENLLEIELPPKNHEIDIRQLRINKMRREHAVEVPELSPEQRMNFKLVTSTLDQKKAVKEASRCLQCDVLCDVCVMVCPNQAMLHYETDPVKLTVPVVDFWDDEYETEYIPYTAIRQKYQVLNIADWCNECGNCTTFCPTAGAPYLDKPRIHLNREGFKDATDGFLLQRNNSYRDLTMKKAGKLATLTESWDAMIFENDDCIAVLDKETFEISHIDIFTGNEGTLELTEITEMKLIYEAVKHLI